MPKVTLTAGLRYDLQWLPEAIALDANNLSPRLGLAWAPGDGHTVVRASGGLYFDRIPLRATSNALQRDGVNYKVAVLTPGQTRAPAFPAVLPSFPAGLLTAITSIDPGIQNGRSRQFSVQVERAVGRVTSVTVGYTFLRGRQILMSRNINAPTLTPAEAAVRGVPNLGRPNPDFGNISQYESIGGSWFDGLTLSFGTRTLTWGLARVSYTFSKSLDTAGNAFFQMPQDNNDVAGEKGPSDSDQRHRLVVSGTIGGVAARSSIARWLGGVQVGYVLSYATGASFNIVAGSDLNNDSNPSTDRPPGVGRNSGRLPRTSTLDVRLSRAVTIRNSHRVDLMIEGFNVFNHVNILSVNNTFGTGITPLPDFGRPTLAGDARQVQLGVRWTF